MLLCRRPLGTINGTTVFGIQERQGQTQLGLYTVPDGVDAYMLAANLSAAKGSNSAVTASLRVREEGGAFRVRDVYGAHTAGFQSNNMFTAPLKIPAHSDIIFRADSVSANNTQVSVRFDMLLVDSTLTT